MSGTPDGRRARGDRRREQLLDAATTVIAAGGAAAVTHRSVAAAAGIPPASVSYYFPRVEDVLVAALTRAGRRYEEAMDDVADAVGAGAGLPDVLLAAIGGWEVRPGDAATAAEYELYLLAARRPELAPAALRWADRLVEVLTGEGVAPGPAGAVVALVEGVLLQKLLGRSLPDDALRDALSLLVTG